MSHFSHNPEAYDEIIAKALAQRLLTYSGMDCEENDTETMLDALQAFISNLQCDRDTPARAFYDHLIEQSTDLIKSEEQAYWESFVR